MSFRPLPAVLRYVAGLAVGGLLAGCAHQPTKPTGWSLTNLNGQVATIEFNAETRAVVFEFLSVECPISNRVVPELERLQKQFSASGIRFIPVYANAGDGPEVVRHHRTEAGVSPEAFCDPHQALADQLGVTITPEVVALAANGRLIYRGRVNDQYAALGQSRPEPTRHDLAEALTAWLADPSATAWETKPVGCRIQRAP